MVVLSLFFFTQVIFASSSRTARFCEWSQSKLRRTPLCKRQTEKDREFNEAISLIEQGKHFALFPVLTSANSYAPSRFSTVRDLLRDLLTNVIEGKNIYRIKDIIEGGIELDNEILQSIMNFKSAEDKEYFLEYLRLKSESKPKKCLRSTREALSSMKYTMKEKISKWKSQFPRWIHSLRYGRMEELGCYWKVAECYRAPLRAVFGEAQMAIRNEKPLAFFTRREMSNNSDFYFNSASDLMRHAIEHNYLYEVKLLLSKGFLVDDKLIQYAAGAAMTSQKYEGLQILQDHLNESKKNR
jgi:hypothetical protein